MAMAPTSVYYGGLFLLLCFGVLEGSGVCSHISYTKIDNVRRSTAYNATTELCDRDFIKDGSWYRFQSKAGDQMPEFNPGKHSCGTYVPIWLKGKHPSTVGAEVDMIACAPLPHVYPFDCGRKYNIKVRNCDSFFLYQLKEPKSCNIAYCAGTKLAKNCSADGLSIPVCPGVVPTIMRPKVRPKDEARQYVSLRCFWDYFNDASRVEFHVKWFKDSNETTHAVQHVFNGTAGKNYYENLYDKQVFQNRVTGEVRYNKSGFEWNKRVFCKVRGRFFGGSWSPWKSSGTIFTGIVVHPRTIYLDECENEREIFVSLRPHLPIRKLSYKFEITYKSEHQNKTIAKICIRGKVNRHKCLAELRESHKFYHPLWIRITAVCRTVETGEKSNEIKVKFHNKFSGNQHIQNNLFWINYDFLPIKITMTSREIKFCKSLTDPNIETFDGRYYNPRKEGTYRLYRNRLTGTEVQARLDYCCNCGVAIKEGYYFKIVELCSSHHQPLPQIRSSHHPEMAKNGFYVEKTSEELTEGQEIIVHMPSGITVTIKRVWRSFDIIIKAHEPRQNVARPGDKHRHSEGLCGNFNGDPNDDFEGLTMPQFAELHRIQTGSNDDIFGYRGNEVQEKKMYKECIEEDICICKDGNDVECNSATTVNECSPPEQNRIIQNLHGDVCRGGRTSENNRLRKRSSDISDDNIDDQDIIPPYNPPKRNFTVPSWPTPSGLTEKNVTWLCNKRIKYSKAGESCSSVTGVDLDAIVNQCISDIQLTDDPSWAVANSGAMNTVCTKNVYKNISYYKNSTDGELKLETTVLDSLCPNDCSDRGNCSNSTCTCFEDYTAADCSISLKDRPKLYGIRKSGLCDVRRRPCRNVGIYAFPLLDSKNLTCHVQEFKVIESAWVPDSSTSLFPGLMMDITEVKCFLPESPVNIGDYGNEGVAAAGIKISVSNNRVNASEESMLFITYDSVCQECNTSTGCQLKADACSISGHCFAKTESHPNDWCRQCLPSISTSSWVNRTDNHSPKFTISTNFYAFLGKELRVQLNAIDPENRTIRYSFIQNTALGASLTKDGFFSWTSTTNDSTAFTFKVTDECGAYSSVNATVVIKDCPCQNSGECFPDYRYLVGAGNFTCTCPVEYTGVLCENDVNECNVSQPCFNGTCKNEIPGFSCSCFAGYTGLFCQAEIDECAQQPCFLGVRCTDLIASFSCGPCPKEYTGDGKNCTRIDGKLDECVKNPQVCHGNANCEYNNGSYACQCTHGYSGDGKNNCTDVNECRIAPDICHRNARCTNTKGSYSCECLKGFTGDGHRSCSDIDECTTKLDACHHLANCSNIPGSFSCQCKTGFSGDGRLICDDIDECQQSSSLCHPLAKCSNSAGSYICQCENGYTGVGSINCTDIDECSYSPPVCHQHAKCINTMGYYSCKCNQGFLGDGKHNCTENQPPEFTTPSLVYAILDKDFQIQINAKDPESQDISFTLLPNGTLKTATMAKQFLTIAKLKTSGTVYIQIEDQMGAKSVLILRVNGIECNCRNEGKCFYNKTIAYPKKASDYQCECTANFSGRFCEIRANPCQSQPCYLGLKCSLDDNSDGFTCEDCPPLFEGDGKQCKLEPNKGQKIEESEMILTNEKWDDQLENYKSDVYKNLAMLLTVEIRKLYKGYATFSYVIIKGFRPGSIIVEFQLIFTKKVEDPLKPLLEVARSGTLGNMTIQIDVDGDEKQSGSDDDKMLGLDKTIFFVIIAAGIVLILLIIFANYYRIKRRQTRRKAKLQRKKLLHSSNNKAEGISFELTEANSECQGEKVDLKVFDNEAIRLDEEIKIQP